MRNSLQALLLCLAVLFAATMQLPAHAVTRRHAEAQTATVWVQVLDSCQQALGGEQITLTGNGQHVVKNIAPGGTRTVDRVFRQCPLQQGNCPRVGNRGCTTFDLPVPTSGSTTYTITETRAADQYSYCLLPDCDGPEIATVHVNPDGSVSATVADGTIHKVFPKHGDYSGESGDPVLFHSWDNR